MHFAKKIKISHYQANIFSNACLYKEKFIPLHRIYEVQMYKGVHRDYNTAKR